MMDSGMCNCGNCAQCCGGHGGATWGMGMKVILALVLLGYGLGMFGITLQWVAIVYALVLLVKAAKMTMYRK